MTRALVEGPAIERVRDALRAAGCRSSNDRDWTCPTHKDKQPSLSLNQGAKGAVMTCHAGCDTRAAIVPALGLTMDQLFDDYGDASPSAKARKVPPPRRAEKPWAGADAFYPYLDENAEVLSIVVRKRGKKFVQYRPDGDAWVGNLNGTRRVLFGLPEVRRAVEAGEPVWITEGEKDAITLWGAGVCASTNAEGAAAWRDSHTESLEGAHVVIWRDADEAGRAGGDKIVQALQGKAASIRRVEGVDGKDAADHFAAGLGLADVVDVPLLAAAPTEEPPPEPDPGEPEDGAALLDEVSAYLGRFIAHPSGWARVAHTLWVAHCHAMQIWDSTPRLAFLSPERGCGKTRALEVSELLVPRPVLAVNATPAYLFRKVSDEAGAPTILYDEIDTVFGPRARENEDVRAMLNAGHRKGAVTGRCVVRGKVVTTEELPAYCAVALAGIGDLPDTIQSRSVVVRMRRRAPGEHVDPFRPREQEADGHGLRDRLAAWARANRAALEQARPQMPDGVEDRDADVWEALLALADLAGGPWPDAAREAAVQAVEASHDDTPSLGIQLLRDIRETWPGGTARIETQALLLLLHDLEESPWGDLRGKPLDANGLASRLHEYGVKPNKWREGVKYKRGYDRENFRDPWDRYLSEPDPEWQGGLL